MKFQEFIARIYEFIEPDEWTYAYKVYYLSDGTVSSNTKVLSP